MGKDPAGYAPAPNHPLKHALWGAISPWAMVYPSPMVLFRSSLVCCFPTAQRMGLPKPGRDLLALLGRQLARFALPAPIVGHVRIQGA